jgi:hypothetical protein
MLTNGQVSQLSGVAGTALDEAEKIWGSYGEELQKILAESSRQFSMANEVPSHIPGHPLVPLGKPVLDEFIAIAIDMRGSTTHLRQAISGHRSKISQLQRVYYESAALLPVLAKVITERGGSVTEFLGDGVLGLFQVPKEDRTGIIYSSYGAAKDSILAVRRVVNPILNDRYGVPPEGFPGLKIGVGLSISKAVVTLVGLPEAPHPKAFGECVFCATKFAKGHADICVDPDLRRLWPTGDDGKLEFHARDFGDLRGYIVVDPEL